MDRFDRMTMRAISAMIAAIVLALAWCGAASAQTGARVSGQVLDLQGNPYPGVIVTMTNKDSNQTITVTTDKEGKFTRLGLRGGDYTINFRDPKNPQIDKTITFPIANDQENTIPTINFKELAEEYAREHPSAEKLRAAENAQFQGMKQHFQAGLDAMTAYGQDRSRLATASAADKQALMQKIAGECQTAATEFGEAAKSLNPKDTKNPSIILGDEGTALECEEKYADAADAFEKAIAAKPDASLYTAHATDLVKAALVQPGVPDAQLDDALAKATADCNQAATLDPTKAATCWRNVGIGFYNKQRMKQATEPFRKATAADPTNADGWFFLGAVLLNQMDAKQQGNQITYTALPGTKEAYEKYLELAPSGPHAAEAKSALDTIAALTGSAQSTVITNKKKH